MTTSFSTQITDKDDQGRTILTRESPSGNWLCGLFEQQFKVEVKVVVRMVLNEETAKFHEQGELPWLHSVLRCELLQFFPKKSKRKQRAEDKQVKFARVGSAATSGGGQNTAPGPGVATGVQGADDKQVKFARVGSFATSSGGQNTAPGPAAGTVTGVQRGGDKQVKNARVGSFATSGGGQNTAPGPGVATGVQGAEDKQVKFARVGSAATSGGGQNTAPGPAAGTRVQPGAASSNFASKANTDERIGDFVFFERCSGFAVSERVRVHRAHTPLMEVGGKIGTIKKITKRKDFHVYFMVEMEDASMRVNKVRSKIPGKEPHWLVCCIGGIEKLV